MAGDGPKIGDAHVEITADVDISSLEEKARLAATRFNIGFGKELQGKTIHFASDVEVDHDPIEKAAVKAAIGFLQTFQTAIEASAQTILKAVPGQFAEILATPLGPVLIAVLAPLIAAAGITLGATLGGAIAAGLGTVVLGGALFAAFQDARVKAAAKDIGSMLLGEISIDSAPFKNELLNVMGGLKDTLSGVDFSKTFGFLIPALDRMGGALRDVIPGIVTIGEKIAFLEGPISRLVADFIRDLVPAVDRFVDVLIRNLPGIQAGFSFLGNTIIGLIDLTGALIDKFAHLFAGLASTVADALDVFATVIDALDGVGNALGLDGKKFRDMADNIRGTMVTSDAASMSLQELRNAGLDPMGRSVDQATVSWNDLRAAMEKISNPAKDLNEQMERLSQAHLTLRDSVNQGGASLDIHTQAGLRNRDALEGMVQESNNLALQEIATGVSVEDATRHHRERTDTVINEMFHTEELRGTARGLRDDYTAIPTDVKTVLELLGFTDVNDRLDNLKVKQIALWKNISQDEARKNIEKGMASGGPITGPGGPKDDQAGLFPLSNGEFVVQSSAVSKYGSTFMHQLNQGRLKGFAKGGQVGNEWPFPVDVSQTEIQDSWADGPKLTRFGTAGAPGATAAMGDLSNISGSLGDWIKAASAFVNIEWPEGLVTLIMRESGGNPFSLNLWDSNAMMGDPSGGLMQTIGATFRAHADPRVPGGMFDPVANIVAGMNYIHARYGSLYNVQQAHAELPPMGYDNGGMLPPGASMVVNKTGKPERVLNDSQWDAMSGDCTHEINISLDGEPFQKMIVQNNQSIAYNLRKGRGRT